MDGLKVAHAMVLLREPELQAHKVPNPTDYIKKTAALAGEDDVHVALHRPGTWLNLLDHQYALYAFTLLEVADRDTDAMMR